MFGKDSYNVLPGGCQQQPPGDRLSVYDIARHLGVYHRTVCKWVDEKHLIPTEGTNRETWRFTREYFRQWCLNREFPTLPEPGSV